MSDVSFSRLQSASSKKIGPSPSPKNALMSAIEPVGKGLNSIHVVEIGIHPAL